MNPVKFALVSILFWAAAHATSVRPPIFDELVGDSELIFRGRVTEVQTGWEGEATQRHIVTCVTFQVDRTLKGTAPAALTLTFMGGQIDGHRLEIVGQPRFAVGERGVYFVENRGGRLCPLVRLRHGRYRVVADEKTATERIARDDFTPLLVVAQVSDPLPDSTVSRRAQSDGAGLTLTEFEDRITERAKDLPAAGSVR